MDKIRIENLEIYGYHGALPEETRLGQKFLLSMTLHVDTEAAGRTDDLEQTVNYAAVCKKAEQVFLEKPYRLLEACGEALCRALLLAFPTVRQIDLTLKKPWAPIGSHLECVALELTRKRHRAYLGLGSNLGDRQAHLNAALAALDREDTRLKRVSSFYTTKPVGYLEQADFLNAAVELETLLSPKALLDLALSIERSEKRERIIHWGPRTLDIDLLLYDDLVTETEELVLPHPRMHERLFVLLPLSEIAPMAVHPLTGKRIYQIKEALENQ